MPSTNTTTKVADAAAPSAPSASAPSASAAAVKSSSPYVNDPDAVKFSWSSIRSRLNYIHVVILFGTPIAAVIGMMYVPLTRANLIWALVYYFMTGTGITAGYHRLWAHKSYEASWPIQFYLLACATGALEGSLKWWAGGHRVHHRYTDTRFDPYNSGGGLFYAHFGWMLVHPRKENQRYADISDLNQSTMIRLQHRYYTIVGPFMALLFPSLVAWAVYGDFMGGYVYAGIVRLFFVHHSTFCVNSIAHYLGEQSFDDERTPRDSIFTALLTFGEGFHNFHHEFPNDYRNAIKWYQYDPTKWLIKFWNVLGLTHDLKTFSDNEIRLGMLNMKQKHLDEEKKTVVYPVAPDQLTTMTRSEFIHRTTTQSAAPQALTIVHGVVHDISPFISQHPGGAAMIKQAVGKDASAMFEGETGVYRHSKAAHNVLGQFRVARLVENTDDLAVIGKVSTTAGSSTSTLRARASSKVQPADEEKSVVHA